MRHRTLSSKTLLIPLLLLAAACGGEDPSGGGLDGGAALDTGATATDAGQTARDAGAPDAAEGTDACTPRAECAPEECGPVDDGCGGTLSCAACDCTPDTFEADCPSRPCEVASGCAAGACVYEPLICDLEICACPEGETCDDETPRPCGGGCPTLVCDPRPSGSGDRVSYANACVPRIELRCGLCDLGAVSCGSDPVLGCDAPALPWLDPATAECNGASPVSSVVFVDALVEDGTPDGSRAQPFTSVADGIAAAITRGARLVVIGRSPEVMGTQGVVNGISLLGGYSGWPEWQPDPTQRPTFHATPADVADGRLVGLRARNISEPTRVEHVRVLTDDLSGDGGESNVGIAAVAAPALELVDVIVEVGRAADGTPGAPGVTPNATGTPAGAGAQGYGFASGSACQPMVRGGAGGTRICDGAVINAASGGGGGSGSGAMNRPPSVRDECSTVSSLACFHIPGADSAGGAAGGHKQRPALQGDGANGGPASGGADGDDGSPTLALVDGMPVPTGVGLPGDTGDHGSGGGGGSTGQISRSPKSGSPSSCNVGGAGGGGGAGGCGGGGGGGGGAGGWTFGLTISGSEGLTLEALEVSLRSGGRGGPGGAGAPGTAGGTGGAAGPQPSTNNDVALWAGSRGGDGSDGGDGGTGGTGADGLAVGIFCGDHAVDSSVVSSTGPQTGFEASRGCE